jgi:hypothetical protein
MTSDPIRDLLARLPAASMIPTPPGCRAILRHRVEQAGGDPDAVLAWVEAHGGRGDRSKPIASTWLQPGRRVANEIPGNAYYVVPDSALED